jgi:hypothetical protein
MAVITVYVRSPISGYITGRDKYCVANDTVCNGSGNPHGRCRGWSSPVDIGGSGSLYLRVNYPNVRSVVTYVELRCCAGTTCGNNFKRTITVELYGRVDGLCYIGSVMYGHVSSPAVSNGETYNLTSGSLLLGTVTSGSCSGCSTGPHSHMERSGGSVVAPCCGAAVSTSTNIYRFTWDNALPCPA